MAAVIDGRTSPIALRNPLTYLRHREEDRWWLASNLQMLVPALRNVSMKVTFGAAVRTADAGAAVSQKVVAEMLKVAKVGKNDVLYDLGSGDGRIVIEAAKRYGIRAIGVDLNAELVAKAREIAELTGTTTGTVLARLHRGRKQLERALWDYAKERGLLKGERRT